jgi:hypothetical protein
MTDDEKRLMIERAFEFKEKLQDKLKKSREETEQRKKEIQQLQSKVDSSSLISFRKILSLKVSEGVLIMEGEEEVLRGTEVKYFELFPERTYKQGKRMRTCNHAQLIYY